MIVNQWSITVCLYGSITVRMKECMTVFMNVCFALKLCIDGIVCLYNCKTVRLSEIECISDCLTYVSFVKFLNHIIRPLSTKTCLVQPNISIIFLLHLSNFSYFFLSTLLLHILLLILLLLSLPPSLADTSKVLHRVLCSSQYEDPVCYNS